MDQNTEHLHYQIRPRFNFISNLSADDIISKIKSGLDQPNATCIGMIKHGYATLRIPKNDQHYWSPQLSLSLEEKEGGTEVRGLYGPRPSVWTMFVFFYSVIGFAIIVVGSLGLSYMSLDKSAKILWAVPVLLLVFFSLYLVAYSGQKLGNKQIKTLHDFVEDAIKQKIPQK